ncbi:MAG: CooT family nickel-binding protein [Gracilibacteraceae bacterium]|jgi:predicted RNA-binding protein|nr:CooT family nickel-binding protein [Gracilibacteraceae bacterium]
MCLSTAYQTTADGEQRLLCEHVCHLRIEGNTISLVDLLGNNVTVAGVLHDVDLLQNIITIHQQ